MCNPASRDLGQPDSRPAAILDASLLSVLNVAEKALTLGELSQRLHRPFRAVAVATVAACSTGAVDRLEGGKYAARMRPALLELFSFVHSCEKEWERDERLRLFASGRTGR